ncbi:hypothetical protein HKX48_004193 [Thoreauomyces humboldtii]|nr:hypothetical protein HKX48_004193 [Thoreauomyces humboldtii]
MRQSAQDPEPRTASSITTQRSEYTLSQPPAPATDTTASAIASSPRKAPPAATAFTSPRPLSTDPTKLVLRNPWDGDRVILDARAEQVAAAAFFALHVVRPVVPDSGDRASEGTRRPSYAAELIPASSIEERRGVQNGEGFAMRALLPPLVDFLGEEDEDEDDDEEEEEEEEEVLRSVFEEEMLTLFDDIRAHSSEGLDGLNANNKSKDAPEKGRASSGPRLGSEADGLPRSSMEEIQLAALQLAAKLDSDRSESPSNRAAGVPPSGSNYVATTTNRHPSATASNVPRNVTRTRSQENLAQRLLRSAKQAIQETT